MRVIDNVNLHRSKLSRISLFFSLAFVVIGIITVSPLFAAGDGNLLKRSPEETCHACHKTDQNAPADPNSIKSHNSANLGSTKWGGNWGTSAVGSKYGAIVCTTCHTAHDTKNIYLMKEVITTPDGSNWGSSGETRTPAAAAGTVDFRALVGGAGAGTMANNNTAHTTSNRICEVCHTYDNSRANGVGWFAYNMASAVPHSPAISAGAGCTSCHNHKSAFKGSCTDCHGYPPINDSTMLNTNPPFGPTGRTSQFTPSPKAAGAHNKHYTTLGYGCDTCHTGGGGLGSHNANPPRIQIGFSLLSGAYTSGSYDAPAFSNANYAVAAGNLGTTVTSVGTSRTCSNIYCHSTAQDSSGGSSPTYASPVWEGGAMTCGSCHKDMDSDGAAPGSHVQHAQGSVTNYACATCHSGYTETTVVAATHVNNSINLIFSGAASGTTYSTGNSHAPGSGYGNCTTSNCHGMRSGARSPNWGSNTGNHICTKCHGNPTVPGSYVLYKAAPGADATGVDLEGQTGAVTSNVSNDAQVGAHDTHLRSLGGYKTGGVACSDCHAVTALGDAGHMDGSTTMTWSNLAKNIGTVPYNADKGAITPGYTSPTCTTNYCHGGGFAAAVQGTGLSPSWVDGNYLANPAALKNSADCNKCHVSPPLLSAKFAHSSMTISTDCSVCHNHNGGGDARHINGTLEAIGGPCNSCHSYDAVAGAWGSVSHKDAPINEGWGAHAKHINHIKARHLVTLNAGTDAYGTGAAAAVCGTCHTNVADNHTMGNTSGRLINFGDGTYKSGGAGGFSFLFDPSAPGTNPPAYNGISGTSSLANLKTCSNVGCHFRTTPVWAPY